MRRLALAYILIALVAFTPAPAVAAGNDVVFAGSGWGHGVGMTQYGAYGMALQGSTAPQILAKYYPTTVLGTVNSSSVKPFLINEPMPLWVGVMQDELTVTFRPQGGNATVCTEGSSQVCLPTPAAAGELWRFEVLSEGCVFSKQVGGAWTPQIAPGTCRGSVTPNNAATTIELVYLNNRYGNGVLRLRPGVTTQGVHAIWQTSVEAYVRGITEVPDSWPMETLKAQAIAARSYALARAGWRGSAWDFNNDRKNACYCNLYATNWDQVWSGAANNPNFAAAATATAGTIVQQTVGKDAGKVAEAVYSSSSGGTTEYNSDYWGGLQLPYLIPVDDSASKLPAVNNPYASWTRTKSNAAVANALGWDSITAVDVTARYASGSAKTVRIQGTNGGQSVATNVTGNWVRITFGLPSRYFSAAADGSIPSTPSGSTTSTTFPVTDGTAPYVPPTTTTTTTTTTSTSTSTVPGSTTTSSTEAPVTTTSTTTTAPPTTTTTTEAPHEEEVVVVEAPADPGTGEPAPVTNKAEEAKGEGETVPPPPVPVEDAGFTSTIPWQDRLEGEVATPDYLSVGTLPGFTSTPNRPLELPAEAPAVALVSAPTRVEIPLLLASDALPEVEAVPSSWRQTVYNAASTIGDWIAGVAAWATTVFDR